MSNAASVSFKLPPDHYAVLKAMAASEKKTLSEFLRDTVTEALDLNMQAQLLTAFYSKKDPT